MGKRILLENDNFERAKIYGQEICSRVSISLGKSSSQKANMKRTAEKIADEYKINTATVSRAGDYAEAIGKLEEGLGKKAVDEIVNREVDLTRKELSFAEEQRIYGQEIGQRVASSLGKSHRTIKYAMQFAKEVNSNLREGI